MSGSETKGARDRRRPLAGRTVVVTRPKAQAAELVRALEALGARVVRCPTIRIAPPDDAAGLRRLVLGDGHFDWVVFTSANGVRALRAATEEAGRGIRGVVGDARVCCIGPATANAAEAAGLTVSLIPDTHVAEGLVEALASDGPLGGRRVLLPLAAGARDVLPTELRARGAVVQEVTAYRTLPVRELEDGLMARLRDGVDLVTFTSPSSVRAFDGLMPGPPIAPAAVIGPVTAATARGLGYDVTVQASDFSVTGLVRAIRGHYKDELP